MTSALGYIIAISVTSLAIYSILSILKYTTSKKTWIIIGTSILLLIAVQIFEIYNLSIKEINIPGIHFIIAINLSVAFIISIAILRMSHWLKKLRQTEKDKHESEMRFQLLFENSGDEIFLEDFEANIIEVNEEVTRKLGYTREELLKKNIAELKTPKYTSMVRKNLRIVESAGQHVFETEHLTKDGRVIFLEMSSRVIDYMGGRAILSIGRDITARKDIERKIAAAIMETEEKERKRFAADLHDDLAPLLSTIKLYIDLLKKGNFNKISPQEILQSIDELIEKAIVSTRQISNNIMPSILEDFGLAVAVKDFCDYINNTKSISIKLDCSQYKRTSKKIEETVLFQSIKELVHNTLKHSNANNIEIFLESNDDNINLYYQDDGIGFDVDKKTKNPGGLGLNNIINKVKTINGLTMLKSEPEKGMTMLITIKNT
jgi:PAS domain S-box-containing protein